MKSKKQNIAILVTSFTSGGAEKVISLLLKPLILDFKVTLVLFYNEIHFTIPYEVDVVILKQDIPSQGFITKFVDLFSFYRKYAQILNTRNIDFSLSFLAFPNLINALLSKRNRTYKVLLSERGFPSDNTTSKISYLISKISYPIIYNRADRLFSNSTFINEDLKGNFGVKIPMEVIYNPIEIPKQTKTPDTWAQSNEIFKLITVGSVDKRKNQVMVIKSLKLIDDPNVHFDIYGVGPLEGFLKEKIIENGLGLQVKLKGRVKSINKCLFKADCFILSSFTEGFPNALLEAMAMGLPCISTNCLSGPLEMLNNNRPVTIENGEFVEAQYGLLINNDDNLALAKAIGHLQKSPSLREKYSALSLKRSLDYDLGKIYAQFKSFVVKE